MKPFLLLLFVSFVALIWYSGVTLAREQASSSYLPVVYQSDVVPTASATGTATATPTATVTPTITPLPYSYYNDENPNLPIPDGPDGVVTTTLIVPDAVTIRELRVFLNIQHDDVSDLEITMIAPNGAPLLLHSQGEDAGSTTIRRWFSVTGSDLESISGSSAAGVWTLELWDWVANRTGELLSWEIEIYP